MPLSLFLTSISTVFGKIAGEKPAHIIARVRFHQAICLVVGSCFMPQHVICSVFGDIYDEAHFMQYLSRDIRVVKELPQELMAELGNLSNIYNVRAKAWARPEFYWQTVLPKLRQSRFSFTPLRRTCKLACIWLQLQ